MLMGNPWGPATFVPALRGCLSLGTGWQPPGCLLLDNQHAARYWSQSSRGMPAGCEALIGVWWAEDRRLSRFSFCFSSICDAPGGGLLSFLVRGKWKCSVRHFVMQQVVCMRQQRDPVDLIDFYWLPQSHVEWPPKIWKQIVGWPLYFCWTMEKKLMVLGEV